MNDGKEVKRWELNLGNGCKSDQCYAEISVQPDGYYVLLADHFRIADELQAEVERLTRGLVQIQHILKSRHLTDGQMCLAALSEATCTILNDKELAAIEKEGEKGDE